MLRNALLSTGILTKYAPDTGAGAGAGAGKTDTGAGETDTGAGKPDTGAETPPAGNEGDGKPNVKTFTQEEVNTMINERLARERKANEEKESENKKLAKMNSDQKQQYELEKANERAAAAEKELARVQMRTEVVKQLGEAGLNNIQDGLLDLVVTDQAEANKKNIDALKAFAETIRSDVRAELSTGKPPKTARNNGNVGGGGVIDATKFNIMSYAEKAALRQSNPELFNQLAHQ